MLKFYYLFEYFNNECYIINIIFNISFLYLIFLIFLHKKHLELFKIYLRFYLYLSIINFFIMQNMISNIYNIII